MALVLAVKICVGCAFPGGPEAEILYPFEDSELFDYYTVSDDGDFELTAETRRCLCSDLIEPVVRRGIDAVVLRDLSPSSLLKFSTAGVRVFVTPSRTVGSSLDMLYRGQLSELTIKDMAKLGKKHKEMV